MMLHFAAYSAARRIKIFLFIFINDVLELQDGEKIKEITFLPTIAVPEIAAKKQSVVDVLCKDENGVQLIIEMQVSPQEGFEKKSAILCG
jgi:hypothetical protein